MIWLAALFAMFVGEPYLALACVLIGAWMEWKA